MQLPACPRPESHVWHLFVVLVRGVDRGRLQSQLAEQRYCDRRSLSDSRPAAAGLRAASGCKPGDFPIAEDVMARCLSLPMFAALSDEQIDYVAATIQDA